MTRAMILLVSFFILFISSCQANRKTPEYITKQYLLALKNKDWEKAKSYSTKEHASNLEMMKSLGTDFGITDVKDIECEISGGGARCFFAVLRIMNCFVFI